MSDKAKKNYRDPKVPRRIYLPAGVRLRNARAILIEAAHRRMSLDDIAASFGVSRKHLFRLFHEQGAPSPMRQVRRLRLEEVAKRTCDEGESMESLALECHYSDGSSLRRALRRAFRPLPDDLHPNHRTR